MSNKLSNHYSNLAFWTQKSYFGVGLGRLLYDEKLLPSIVLILKKFNKFTLEEGAFVLDLQVLAEEDDSVWGPLAKIVYRFIKILHLTV